LNEVSIICDVKFLSKSLKGSLVSPPDHTRTDKLQFGSTISKPSAYQIKKMLDGNNFKPDAYGYKTIAVLLMI
jgi:hypothetical protein